MNTLFFWRNWSLGYRLPYLIGFLAFIASLGYLGYTASIGDEATMWWQTNSDTDIVPVVIDTFAQNFFEFSITADAYLLVERFEAVNFQLNYLAHYICFAMMMLGVVFLLTSISDLPIIWYAIGLTFVLFLITTMGLDTHKIFAPIDDKKMALMAIIALLAPTFLFRTFLRKLPYFVRMITYSAIIAWLCYFVNQRTVLEFPVISAVNYMVAIPIIVFGLFMFANAHEVGRVMVFLVSNGGGNPKRNMTKFTLIFGLYLMNVVYGYIHVNYEIDWGFYFIPPQVLFIITTLLGIWGFKRREVQYENIFPFAPDGAFIYLGVALISIASYAFSYANANESLWKIYEDLIFYSHIGVGVSFFAYVFFNFKHLLNDGQKVHRVLFQPRQLMYTWIWFLGLLIGAGFTMGNGFFIASQGFGAYFTGLGDIDMAEGKVDLAKYNYDYSLTQDPSDRRTSYTMASIARASNNKIASYFYFKDSKGKGNPKAYANMSQIQDADNQYFQAIFDLEYGVKENPESGELYNNLALLLNETNLGDSAYIYFELAKKYANNPEIVESNMYSLWAKYPSIADNEGFLEEWKPREYVNSAANELAFLTKVGKNYEKELNEKFLPDSVLTTMQMCYLYNFALNKTKNPDDKLIQRLQKYTAVPANSVFNQYLELGLSNLLFAKGNYAEAFQSLETAKESASEKDNYFPNLLGLRQLQHEQYELAAKNFEEAFYEGNVEATLNWAIALSELPNKEKAVEAWRMVQKVGSQVDKEVAQDFLRFLIPELAQSLNLQGDSTEDLTKYRYLHYQQVILKDSEFDKIYQAIQNPTFQIVIASERANYYVAQKNEEKAGIYITKAASESAKQENLIDMANSTFQVAYLNFVYFQGNLNTDFYDKAIKADYPRHLEGLQNFYSAEYKFKNRKAFEKDSLKIEQEYRLAMSQLPYKHEVKVQLNNFYLTQNQAEKGYNMLVSSVEIYPQSAKLIKAYILSALEMGYMNYAEYGMEDLEKMVSETDYQTFLPTYQRKVAEIKKQLGTWDGEQ
jgi:tetratricopeptide (TPR) repeat protein